MPSNRLIPLLGGGTILQVHALEDGVFAIPFLDFQHGLLDFPFPGVGGFICLSLLLFFGVVGEQIQPVSYTHLDVYKRQLTGSSPNCIGIDIPAGLKVDIYKYYYPVGSTEKRYELLGHFDTTDGKSITIGKDTSTTGNSGSNSTSKPSNSGTIEEDWGNVRKTYHPGQTAKPYSNSYTDVASNAWYYDAVMTLTEGGLLAGYGGGKFGPNDALTRGQVAIIVTRLVGNPMPDDYLNWGNGYKPYADNATASRAFAAIRLMDLIDRCLLYTSRCV